jgi:hypothetical protein
MMLLLLGWIMVGCLHIWEKNIFLKKDACYELISFK